MTRLELRRPDDWHVHFRDGEVLQHTVPPIAAVFGRAVAMPNLKPPVTSAAAAIAYALRIRAAGARPGFLALPSLYLTDLTQPEDIHEARTAGLVAAKLYPVGATTHSDAGVSDVARLDDVFAAMSDAGLVLQLHGEVTDRDPFEREARFVAEVLSPLCARHPLLKVVLEHVTTAVGVAFVRAAGENVAATITAHHLEVDRSDLFRGGLRPHLYCLPVPKTRADREALLDAALSGERRFFLGSDSAPHPKRAKESGCCPAGVYTGDAVILHYAEVFERHGAIDRLEPFASEHGADFYGLPRNADRIALERGPRPIAETLRLGADEVVPYRAGETLGWRLVE